MRRITSVGGHTLNNWIRVGVVILVAAAAILVAGLLMPLATEHDALGTVDCGTALSIDYEVEDGERVSCEGAALNRRTLVYLTSGLIGGFGLIVLAFGLPLRPGTGGPKHPSSRLA